MLIFTGIISVGNDISQLFASVFLSYYAGRGHRPRWMAFGLYTIAMYCVLTALPHFLYGSGEDALLLTTEYGATFNENSTLDILEKQKRQTLCENKNTTQCELEDGNVAPQVILFIAQLISGVGGSLYYTLGVSYMDDNIKKSKTPALISKRNNQYIDVETRTITCFYFLRFLLFSTNAWASDRLFARFVLFEYLYITDAHTDDND